MSEAAEVDVVIAGGGIAGLAAAHTLAKRGRSFRLLEAGPRWGGVIRSETLSGFLLEGGPDSMLAQKPEALALCRELGLGPRLIPTNTVDRTVYVLHGGRLHPMPDGMVLGVPTRLGPLATSGLFSWPGKLRMGLDLVLPPNAKGGDESIGAFMRRRLGAESLRLADALLAGIHAGDPDRLSLRATFPRFAEMEERHGSLILGLLAARPKGTTTPAPAFYSLPGGLGEMVDAVVARLPPASLQLEWPVTAIERDDRGFLLRSSGRGSVRARALVMAVPAPRAAPLLRALSPAVATSLGSIPFASTAVVYLGYRRADVQHPLDGYGLLAPHDEGLRTSALSFVSTKFPGRAPEGQVLLRAFLGSTRDPSVLDLDDGRLVEVVQQEMGPVLGLRGQPILTRVYRWPRGTPQMEVGHLERLASLEGEVLSVPGLFLAGSGLRVTGIPDTVADATRVAEAAAAFTAAPSSAVLQDTAGRSTSS